MQCAAILRILECQAESTIREKAVTAGIAARLLG